MEKLNIVLAYSIGVDVLSHFPPLKITYIILNRTKYSNKTLQFMEKSF